ncbi:MAG: hypothetical protein K2Y32_06505 [Candidatus Obscuribacterales bacterium]|nr:hypothetical protein [Candidatus Obscuribacterales bacterium]
MQNLKSTAKHWARTLLALSLSFAPAMAQAPEAATYENWQSAPPGAYLKTPAAKPVKTQTTAKPVAKAVPKATKAAAGKAGQTGPSGAVLPSHKPFIETPAYAGQQDNSAIGQSDWVTPNTLGNTNTGLSGMPVQDNDADSSFQAAQSDQAEEPGQSGWNVPANSMPNNQFGGNFSSAPTQSGWSMPTNTMTPNSMNNNQAGGNFANSTPQQSGWNVPGNSNIGNSGFSNSGFGNSIPVNSMGSNNASPEQSGWQLPGGKVVKTSKTRPTSSSQSQSGWQMPQGGNSFSNQQQPLFGQVLEQEAAGGGGNFQSSGAMPAGNFNGNGSGAAGNLMAAPQQSADGMPAGGFHVSPEASAMPETMNLLMNMAKQNQVQNRTMGSAPRRGMTTPPIVRGVTNQVGRTVNRAVNRSVNQMLYRGLNSLRF